MKNLRDKHILIMIHYMNLGGIEKALLSLLTSLEGKVGSVELLLLEKRGNLLNQVPSWVKITELPDYVNIKPFLFDPPLSIAIKQLKNRKYKIALGSIVRFVNIKLTKRWYLNYIHALKDVRTFKSDIAISFSGPADFMSYFILEKVESKCKIEWIHFDITKIIHQTNFGKKFYPKFDKFFCVSENARSTFLKVFPELTDKTEVFENIVSKNLLIDMAEQGETFIDDFKGLRILTIGRLSKEKGQDMIPNVVEKLKNLGYSFRWYLIGDGNLRPIIEDKIKQYGIEDDLVLLGSKINPYSYLKNCNLYVQSSLHEGYCLTIHEAKVFIKPVITTSFLSASNLIEDNEDGLIVPISVDGLYNGVKQVFDKPELLQKFNRTIKIVIDKEISVNKLHCN